MLHRPIGVGRLSAFAFLALLLVAGPAHAAGSGMPWEGPIQQFVDSITGPIAQAAGVIAIVITGIGFAFSQSGGVMQKGMMVALGLCCAFAASTFFLDFFGFAGGAVL